MHVNTRKNAPLWVRSSFLAVAVKFFQERTMAIIKIGKLLLFFPYYIKITADNFTC